MLQPWFEGAGGGVVIVARATLSHKPRKGRAPQCFNIYTLVKGWATPPGDVAELVGDRGAASAGVVDEADRAAVGIGNPGQPVHDVVGKGGDVALRVGDGADQSSCFLA